MMRTNKDIKILSFPSAKKWEQWLEKNHEKSQGIWLRFYKKNSGIKSVNYAEALDEALCFGWIDSQLNKYDEKSYIQKFTPRRSKSIWSKRNTEHIARLTKEKRMRPAGMKQVEEAKSDGRWDNAYHPPSNFVMPRDFMIALNKNKKAKEFYTTLNKANKFAVFFMLQNAKKPETRQRRIKKFIQMFARGEKLY